MFTFLRIKTVVYLAKVSLGAIVNIAVEAEFVYKLMFAFPVK